MSHPGPSSFEALPSAKLVVNKYKEPALPRPHSETPNGLTVLLTGLPSAGKTTVATEASSVLTAQGFRSEILDGDQLRESISADLGFNRNDRRQQLLRASYIARLLNKHGVIVLLPIIAPYRSDRDYVRRDHKDRGLDFMEVYVDAPLQECMLRDVKGLYARAAAGHVSGLTGFDGPYEEPTCPDLTVHTVNQSASVSSGSLLHAIAARMDLNVEEID